MAAEAGGRGPKSTSRRTCSNALLPENSSHGLLCGCERDSPLSQPQHTSVSEATTHQRSCLTNENRIDICEPGQSARLSFTHRQAHRGQHTLQIIIAVVFNFDPATIFGVVDKDVSAEMLLKPALQIRNCG